MTCAARWIAVVVAITLAASMTRAWAQAPPVRIAVIYGGGETTGPIEVRRAAPAGVDLTVFAPGTGGETLEAETPLDAFDLIFVDGSAPAARAQASRIAAMADRVPVVVVLPSEAGLTGTVDLRAHPWIEAYWAQPSQDNYAGLLRYLTDRVLGRGDGSEPPAPVIYPAWGFYHPAAPALAGSLDAYLSWYRGRRDGHAYDPNALTVGISVHMVPYLQHNVAHIAALVEAIEARGQNAIVLAAPSSPPISAAFAPNGLPVIDVLLFTGERLHQRDREAGLAGARALGVPILSTLNQHGVDASGFADLAHGLQPALMPIVLNAERDGLFEPIVVSARGPARDGRTFIESLPAQVAWRVDRALAWARLHRAANREKRVVFTFWSEGGGRANAGGDPDDFLDVPASLLRVLEAMRARGYDVGADPLPDRDTLVRRMADDASNVGNWAPAELARRVEAGQVALVPEAQYLAWFERLPGAQRDEIVEMWGPPPGDVMVHTDAHGQRFLVIPRLVFGHVIVAAHPDWGLQQNTRALMAAGALPPHHQYVAFFLWLQREWRADAWVSFFSNIVLQPGKGGGPDADDYVALLLGSLPHIHPERLGSNGGVANKRKGMALTPGWYNIVVPADASGSLTDLRGQIARDATLDDGPLREEAAARLRQTVVSTGVDRALDLDVDTAPIDLVVNRAIAHLDDLERAHMPLGTKVLGEAPQGEVLADMVASMIGTDLTRALAALDVDDPPAAARRLVRAVLVDGLTPERALAAEPGRSTPEAREALAHASDYAGRLRGAPREIDALLEALEGRWIEPGPMESPLQRPDAVPPGRVLYALDAAAYPTPEAEALGARQADALVAAHRARHDGAWPTRMAFVLFSGEAARSHGTTEAQILHLLGTRVVRSDRGDVTGVELIPRETLGRPRVDVLATTSGTYRDNYGALVDLIAEATRLAAASPEADNPISAATRETAEALVASGETTTRAGQLATARVFAPAPGAYSPGIQFLARSGDARGDDTRMADLFTSRMSHAYGGDLAGTAARSVFEQQLAGVDAATLPRSSEVNGMLDQPMSAGFLGGLNLAARAITGDDIDLYVSRLREGDNSTIQSAASAIQTELRSRYLNPRWISEMQAHGYDGARNLMFMTHHLDLWSSTASRTVSSADWADVKAVYVDDRHGLGLDTFFDTYNPHAQQLLLADLLGAASRGSWNASAADVAQVAARLARSASDHGAACEAALCRNEALTTQVEAALADVPGGAALAAAYRSSIDRARVAAPAAATPAPTAAVASGSAPVPSPAAPPVITGRALETTTHTTGDDRADSTTGPGVLWGVAGAAFALLAFGWIRRAV
ncbi:MAG: hypothetical protein ABS36_18105 [Acidobacteria bacterium SCN 69-37]|nr:MAG: hypothetical protein ABS36_18105 [Acidobacteria bacterium SCN 69-37]